MNTPAVGARQLESALDRLGSGIGEEGAIEAAHPRQTLGQKPLVGVIVQVRSVNQPGGLLTNHLHDSRMPVAQSVHADAGDEVEVTPALGIENVTAFASRQH